MREQHKIPILEQVKIVLLLIAIVLQSVKMYWIDQMLKTLRG